jgi:hypothetical protein
MRPGEDDPMALCPRCGGKFSEEELATHPCLPEAPAWKQKGAPIMGPFSKVVIVVGALLLLKDAYTYFFRGSPKVPIFGLGFIMVVMGYVAMRIFTLPYEG